MPTSKASRNNMNEHRQSQGQQDPEYPIREARPLDEDEELAELDNPNAGSADTEAGDDDPSQRPITDNKAGG